MDQTEHNPPTEPSPTGDELGHDMDALAEAATDAELNNLHRHSQVWVRLDDQGRLDCDINCMLCGYNLHGTHPDDDCPECGAPARRSLPADLNQLDVDLTCIQCGYNLRAQSADDNCPECGTPVQQSIRTNQLYHANIPWLKRVRSGLMWIIIGICTQIVLTIGIVVITFSTMSGTMGTGTPHMLAVVAGILATMVYSAIIGYAVVLTTSTEPGELQPPRSRTVARVALLATLGIGLIGSFSSFGTNHQTNSALIVTSTIQTIAGAGLVVGTAALMLYLRSLALRVPDLGLARQTTIVLWGLTISLGIVIVGGGIINLINFSSMMGSGTGPMNTAPSAAVMVMSFLICPAVLGMLVFGIWWFVLICLYMTQLSKTIHLAYQRAKRTQ